LRALALAVELIVGMDANMPCIGLAIIARSLKAAVDALKTCEALGIKLSEPLYTRHGLSTTTIIDLPWYVNPLEYLEKRIEAYIRRYEHDIKALRHIWRKLEWSRIKLTTVDADALTPIVRRALERHGLPPRLPATLAEELEDLIYAWGRRWRESYDWSMKVATGKIFKALSRLSRRHSVLIKLEDLPLTRGIPAARRWPHTKLLRLTLGNLPKAWITLVNPRGTSKRCPTCGGRLTQISYRRLRCTSCGRKWHRDEAAALNIATAPVTRVLQTPTR